MRRLSPRDRVGFTLIELLVVIGIIGVLIALILVGIVPLLRRGPDALDMSDISQLQTQINSFKAKYNVFPPSKIRLRSNANEYNNNPDALDRESIFYINQIWPRLLSPTSTFMTGAYTWDAGLSRKPPKPWTAGQSVVLDGDQCLVFFLGGPAGDPNAATGVGGCLGFSPDPQDPCGPVKLGGNQERISFFQFRADRLVDPVNSLRSANNVPTGFPSYNNNWSMTATARPYAYFSSGRSKNGYNSAGNRDGAGNPQPISHEIVPLDNVAPYYDGFQKDPKGNYVVTSYINPTSFQIISAGQDGYFTTPCPPVLPPPVPSLPGSPAAPPLPTNQDSSPPYTPAPLFPSPPFALPYPNSYFFYPPNNNYPKPTDFSKYYPRRCYWNQSVGLLSIEFTVDPASPDPLHPHFFEYWKDNRANFTPNQLQAP